MVRGCDFSGIGELNARCDDQRTAVGNKIIEAGCVVGLSERFGDVGTDAELSSGALCPCDDRTVLKAGSIDVEYHADRSDSGMSRRNLGEGEHVLCQVSGRGGCSRRAAIEFGFAVQADGAGPVGRCTGCLGAIATVGVAGSDEHAGRDAENA